MKRKTARRRKNAKKTIPLRFKLKYYLVFVTIFVLVFISFKIYLSPSYWEKGSKTSILFIEDGEISINIIDPKNLERITINIPEDTYVEVVGNLGKYRLSNAWELGKIENRSGDIVALTITKNFKLPIQFYYKDEKNPLDRGYLGVVNLLLKKGQTDINLKDRISLSRFILSQNQYRKRSINFSEYNFLKGGVLADGERGYEIVSDVPNSILVLFSDYQLLENLTSIELVSSNDQTNALISDVIGVLGGKVINVVKEDASVSGCLVVGKDQRTSKLLAKIFYCASKTEQFTKSYDVRILIGDDYERVF